MPKSRILGWQILLPYKIYHRVVRTYKLRKEGWGRGWVEEDWN